MASASSSAAAAAAAKPAEMKIKVLPTEAVSQQPQWSPYIINGGTALAVSGSNFAVIAGDTRMSRGYSISCRNVPKCYQLTSKCVIATGGMQAEAKTLRKVLDHKIAMYKHKHAKDMSTPAVAQMLSTTLYHKRFFPYYTFNVVGGVDEEGKGAVYGYDAIGSFERIPYGVTGSASALMTSVLDNQIGHKMRLDAKKEFDVKEMVDLVKDCFTVATERDIYTGDSVDIYVIEAGKEIQHINFMLKAD